MARLHYTLVKVALGADIDDNDTAITLAAPLREFGTTNIATIAAPDTLALRVGYEIMHVTAYTSGASTATVARGQEGSTATAHNEGDILRHVQTDLDIPDLSAYAPLASPPFTGEPVAPSFRATGKTGATATPIRLAGGTASGAPASGAHLKGEIVFDDAGVGYYCTVAGTPGTWVSFGGGVSDGDKGDITVSAGGTVWTIDSGAVGAAEVAFTPAGTIAATNVQAAIEEVAAEAVGGASDADDVAIADAGGYFTGTDVETALQELGATAGSAAADSIACRLTRTAAFTLTTSGTTYTIPWDGEEFDSDVFHDNTTNNTRITVPTGLGGLYLVGTTLGCAEFTGANQRFLGWISLNGSTTIDFVEIGGDGNTQKPNISLSTIVSLSAGDYLEAKVIQTTGGSRGFTTSSARFYAVRLGPNP